MKGERERETEGGDHESERVNSLICVPVNLPRLCEHRAVPRHAQPSHADGQREN